jgi:phospholipid-binding lipoprotein MlaA
VRDGVGLLGDYAMNPVNWAIYWHDAPDWTLIPPTVNTLRALPPQLEAYDSAKRDAIDPYISIRSAYVQFREEMVRKSR